MTDFSSFPVSFSTVRLGHSPVVICSASLDDVDTQKVSQWLSSDEVVRANRLCSSLLQKRWKAARGLLRQLLGHLLQSKPEKVSFIYGNNGKPALRAGDTTKFNLSHSGNQVIYAFAHGIDIGIDLEEIHPLTDMHIISRQFFSPSENALLEKTVPHLKTGVFFQIWTLKEAILKAIGTGFTFPSNQFSVVPASESLVLQKQDHGECTINGRQGSATILTLQSGFSAALAVFDS